MLQQIKALKLTMPFGMATVNCYLIQTKAGHILIDTGGSEVRTDLCKGLQDAGCVPGSLELVVLTHGDFDHTGNAAFLRKSFGARIAMHGGDSGKAEHGDMFSNRKRSNFLVRTVTRLLSGLGPEERFSPDLVLADGDDLSRFGLEATVLALPGHSKGSIGVLTSDGELFCGDLFENTDEPRLNPQLEDPAEAKRSLEKLKRMRISVVYPGHGSPFTKEQLLGE